jgi:hypothetical protein
MAALESRNCHSPTFLKEFHFGAPMSLFGLLLPHPADFLFLWLMRRFKGWLDTCK